ncbi:lanC-like protein 2 [Haliotis rubra]|uniref:lanC-like protein 2 n=1 Tax=Haliotis rubra TaxID=36100 RepID=UPI001EE5B6BF|nr:lanC-like protein 2 [Haliotis rubra]
MSDRAFRNPFPDYDGESVLTEEGKLPEPYLKQLRGKIDELLSRVEAAGPEDDDSVYVGGAGRATLYLHLHTTVGDGKGEEYLQKALANLQHPLSSMKGRKLSFMCGDAGPLALGAIVYSKLGQAKKSQDCLQRLESFHSKVISDDTMPDEILFGRTGYLYALLLIRRELGRDFVNSEIISKVVQAVLDSGQRMSKDQGRSHPLMYAWHDKHYLGSAHGLAGIFYMLMQVQDPSFSSTLTTLVKPSIDYMLTLRFPSGNCPSSLGSSSGDKLVHWCHGAPGWIHMFLLAYKTFGDEQYLEAAKGCADVIWKRGLLKKGYGICHGTAGNAYAFLAMFKLTKDQKYLYRACKFADWCCDYGTHGCGTPDRPYSLFEGMSGTIYFLADLLDPLTARFPAFEL